MNTAPKPGQVSLLHAFCLPTIPPPNTPWTPHTALTPYPSACAAHSGLRPSVVGSPIHYAESSSSSCGLAARLPLLSTPHHCGAVTVGYRPEKVCLEGTCTLPAECACRRTTAVAMPPLSVRKPRFRTPAVAWPRRRKAAAWPHALKKSAVPLVALVPKLHLGTHLSSKLCFVPGRHRYTGNRMPYRLRRHSRESGNPVLHFFPPLPTKHRFGSTGIAKSNLATRRSTFRHCERVPSLRAKRGNLVPSPFACPSPFLRAPLCPPWFNHEFRKSVSTWIYRMNRIRKESQNAFNPVHPCSISSVFSVPSVPRWFNNIPPFRSHTP